MSASNFTGGTKRAVPDVIDFEVQASAENIAPNDTVRAGDFTTVNGDPTTDTNECMEVVKFELLPPVDPDPAGDGSQPAALQTWDALRLWDGDSYYPHVRYKPWMMSWTGPDHHLSTPPLGKPVLSGDNNPGGDPIGTATPKFGPSKTVTPAIINDDTAIDQDFRVRMYVWRFKGSEQEFASYLQQSYGGTSFSQPISMSNPYTGSSRGYSRAQATNLAAGTDNLASFPMLTGGNDQLQPKVYPWVMHSTNATDTRPNTPFEFTTRNGRVREDYQRLEFDFTDQRRGVIFDRIAVKQAANLKEGRVVIEERDDDPRAVLSNDDTHQLPTVLNDDGTENGPADRNALPRKTEEVFGRKPVLWDDGGGFRVLDDGTAIPAGDIEVAVIGKYLELTS
jgi:hypothetical protein